MAKQYTQIFRRKREGKTNYHVRKKVLLSRLPFLVIRITNKNAILQISKAKIEGDQIIASVHTRQLIKFGWPFSRKNIPACYLAGLMLGLKAKGKINSDIIVYLGVSPFVKGSRATAAIKGVQDAGLNVRVDPETFPSEERIRGNHIIDYAKKLKETDFSIYTKRFSSYVREGLNVENMAKIFEEVRQKIVESGGAVK
ncbi:MAG: 50S ribosomal protein L18 [Nitrososphaeria archaeon]|nr:50S ribosomal protein L18 [Nitrososphaeria archaeon]